MSFEKLSHVDNSVAIHQRNIQSLSVELVEAKSGIGPAFLSEIFCKRNLPNNNVIQALRYRGEVVKGVEHISTNLKVNIESRWFYQSGFEFAKTAILILNH